MLQGRRRHPRWSKDERNGHATQWPGAKLVHKTTPGVAFFVAEYDSVPRVGDAGNMIPVLVTEAETHHRLVNFRDSSPLPSMFVSQTDEISVAKAM